MILTWSKEPPNKPGYFWIRRNDLSPKITGIGLYDGAGRVLRDCLFQDFINIPGTEFAGPIPEPTNMTATECGEIMKQADEKFRAARHARIRDLAERMAVASLSNPAASPIDDGGKKLARSAIVVASAVVSECERRERGG